ncbi:hypothetical protein ACF0H5_022045 [Mactra antiquata]
MGSVPSVQHPGRRSVKKSIERPILFKKTHIVDEHTRVTEVYKTQVYYHDNGDLKYVTRKNMAELLSEEELRNCKVFDGSC